MSDGDNRLTKSEAWTFPCVHPNHVSAGVVHDFTELAIGAGDISPDPRGRSAWRGGFSSRPSLLADLMPVISASYSARSPRQSVQLKCALRAFWRFLDSYEALCAKRMEPRVSIERLHNVSGPLLDLFSQPGPESTWTAAASGHARLIRALIRDAVFAAGLPELHVSALKGSGPARKETASDAEAMALIRELRSAVLQIYRRWHRADRLAKEGRNLLEMPRKATVRVDRSLTEADAHATYRALIRRLDHPLPSTTMLRDALGLASDFPRKWWPRYASESNPLGRAPGTIVLWGDLEGGLYPTSQDISIFFLLFLARTAWNPATAASLNVDNWNSAYDDEHRWIFAPKERAAGAYQHAISRENHATDTYALVQNLIARNAPLRALAAKAPWLSIIPDVALRSPWLGASLRPGERLFVADSTRTTTINTHLALLIKQHNSRPGANIRIPKVTCSDFRDIAAAAMYRESRYSAWVLMLMLGHSNLATTHRYGYRRAGREESDHLVVEAMHDVFAQIETHKIWDPTLTRARIEGLELSPEALSRLVAHRKNRTYDGSLCSNPRHPPREIDPTHPQDGRAVCAQQHRCASAVCPRAIVLNDSLPWLARRVAELEWNQENMGVVRFHTASDAHDLQVLKATLRQWPESEVTQQVAHWRDQIAQGVLKPIQIGGRH